MFVRRSVIDEVGGFDNNYFLWFEEADLCKRITNVGHIIFFYPHAVIKHQRSSAFVQRRAVWRQWYFAKSCRRYFIKHHGFLSAWLIAVLSFLSLALALPVELINMAGIKLVKKPDL